MTTPKLYQLAEDWVSAWCETHGPEAPSMFAPSFDRQAIRVLAANPQLADRTKDLAIVEWSLVVSHIRMAHGVMMTPRPVSDTEGDRRP